MNQWLSNTPWALPSMVAFSMMTLPLALKLFSREHRPAPTREPLLALLALGSFLFLQGLAGLFLPKFLAGQDAPDWWVFMLKTAVWSLPACLTALWLLVLDHYDGRDRLGIQKPLNFTVVMKCLALIISLLPLLLTLLHLIHPEHQHPTLQALQGSPLTSLLPFMFFHCILVPVCEETVFRGALQSSLCRVMPVPLALIITSAVFAAVHAQHQAGVFFLSMILGMLYQRSHALKYAITLHALFNLIVGYGLSYYLKLI